MYLQKPTGESILLLFNPFIFKCVGRFFFKSKLLYAIYKKKKISKKKIATILKNKLLPQRISYVRRYWRKKKNYFKKKIKKNRWKIISERGLKTKRQNKSFKKINWQGRSFKKMKWQRIHFSIKKNAKSRK